jgi:hypothetical protein
MSEDPNDPSPSPKAIIFEAVAWAVVWEYFFIGQLKPQFYSWAQNQEFWSEVARRKGNLAVNGQDDTVLLFVLASHHMSAGLTILTGYLLGRSYLVLHGVLLEVGFELADIVANLRGVWPYSDGMVEPGIRIALLLHHLPGTLSVLPMVKRGYHRFESIQKLAAWMVLAGGTSALIGGLVSTRNFNNPVQMKQAALLQLVAFVSFVYARFVVFPQSLLELLDDLERRNKELVNLMKFLGGCLASFNTIVLLPVGMKTIRYFIKAFVSGVKINLDDAVVL